MPFAFKLFFTQESALPVRKIWNELAEEKLSSFLKESESSPGVTLGILETGSESTLLAFAKKFASENHAFGVASWGVGTFPTNPAQVFLGIHLSPELSTVHARFFGEASRMSEISPYYKSENWVPHSTLALRCDPKDIPAIVQMSLQHETRLDFWVGSVAIVEIGTARVAGEFPLRSNGNTR